MSKPELQAIRNIGIISHIDAGKTTVSERLLYYTGESHKLGEVHDGTAIMDWMEQEQERGITITATTTTCRWREAWINLVDTPGHIDFTIEVERSLRVLDGAVVIFSAVEGVQSQSESVWRQADRYRVPRICLINKLDRIGADPERVLEQMARRLAARPVLLQIPVGREAAFSGVIDVLEERLLTFVEQDLGATVTVGPVPAELLEEVRLARERVVEAAADFDETILADFLDSRPVSSERLRSALRRGVLACQLCPVLLGSALRNKGMQPLLDAIVDYLPSPLEVPPVPAQRLGEAAAEPLVLPCEPRGPLCVLAFKVLSDEGRKLTYLRIYSGTLRIGDELFNGSRGVPEKLARLFRMHAHRRERIDEAAAGDIVAAVGLKHALTGDTLCRAELPLVLAGLTVPDPVVSLAVEPRRVEDRERLLPALEKLQWEDPTFRVREDRETGQTILAGMGQLHLEIIVDRLRREFGVEVQTGRPQVVYCETVLARRHIRRFSIAKPMAAYSTAKSACACNPCRAVPGCACSCRRPRRGACPRKCRPPWPKACPGPAPPGRQRLSPDGCRGPGAGGPLRAGRDHGGRGAGGGATLSGPGRRAGQTGAAGAGHGPGVAGAGRGRRARHRRPAAKARPGGRSGNPAGNRGDSGQRAAIGNVRLHDRTA
jgi:elongation factor G